MRLRFSIGLLLLCACDSSPSGPNVVLITVDTLRADHLGTYGYARHTSPHTDRMARRGLVFENTVETY